MKTKIKKNWPSQRHWEYEKGFMEFDTRIPFAHGGTQFDLSGRVVNGVPVHVFLYSEDLDIICRRLTATAQIQEYARTFRGCDLHAVAELVLHAVYPNYPFGANDGWARIQILRYLPALSLEHLEDLRDAARPIPGETRADLYITKIG